MALRLDFELAKRSLCWFFFFFFFRIGVMVVGFLLKIAPFGHGCARALFVCTHCLMVPISFPLFLFFFFVMR